MASLIFVMSHSIFRRLSLISATSVALFLVGCDGDDPTVARSQYLG